MEIKKHSEPTIELTFGEFEKLDAVLIIGNGFDLSFGLKTRYSDFMASSYFNVLINNNNNFAKYLKEIETFQNWIDVENELVNYSTKTKANPDKFYQEFTDLSNALVSYLKSISIKSLDKDNVAFKLIKKIYQYNCLIIDFNYTNTISHILSIINPDGDKFNHSIKHIKIHGSLNENNIIFGVEDKAKIYSDHIFLKKSVNKNFRAKNFSKPLAECNSIGIFGHSLGKTDHMYFNTTNQIKF